MTKQLALPLLTGARCGYCERSLVRRRAGNFECPRCAPLLAEVSTVEEWAAFQRRAARDGARR